MVTRKQYDGYEPYDYLEAGEDYEAFATQADPHFFGEPYSIPLDDDEAARAERLGAEETVVSLHEHAFYFPENIEEIDDYCRQGRAMTAYHALAASNLDAVFDWHLDGVLRMHSKNGWKFSEVVHDLGIRAADIAKQDFVVRAGSVDDIRAAHENGQVAIVPSIEGCMMIENEIDRLDVLYGLGVRALGITYSESNALGTGINDEDSDGGLTSFGEDAVERMNKLGILIDPSHASRQTTLDTCEASTDPVMLSHNGARELLDITRLDEDEVLEAVADTGGVIGIQSAPHNVASPDHPKHTIESVMDHFQYVEELVGIDHVSFGPDTLYGDHVGLHKYMGKNYDKYPDWQEIEFDYVEGMENPTEAWHNIVRWLVREGYSDEEIRKVTGGNTLRVLETVW
ncbi:membrane dipeptidase [Halolamina litorea]|uniref:Dipeptidase n=1 Tax=Halolamina litorea TaxID=1515593 RepID=A0ABD6BRJ3_9EURY|nr:membrane dipeptidase [Halolamina litorea]